jgi:hypothetical protein
VIVGSGIGPPGPKEEQGSGGKGKIGDVKGAVSGGHVEGNIDGHSVLPSKIRISNHDTILATAILDCLVHHCETVTIEVKGCRSEKGEWTGKERSRRRNQELTRRRPHIPEMFNQNPGLERLAAKAERWIGRKE